MIGLVEFDIPKQTFIIVPIVIACGAMFLYWIRRPKETFVMINEFDLVGRAILDTVQQESHKWTFDNDHALFRANQCDDIKISLQSSFGYVITHKPESFELVSRGLRNQIIEELRDLRKTRRAFEAQMKRKRELRVMERRFDSSA